MRCRIGGEAECGMEPTNPTICDENEIATLGSTWSYREATIIFKGAMIIDSCWIAQLSGTIGICQLSPR